MRYFKINDVVVCINADRRPNITKGERYTILSQYLKTTREQMVQVRGCTGLVETHEASRFRDA